MVEVEGVVLFLVSVIFGIIVLGVFDFLEVIVDVC